MEDRAVPGWVGLAVGAAVAAAVTTLSFWWEVVAWLQDFEKLAAWVQAVGSIVAILAGFEIARQSRRGDRQRDLELSLERKAEARRLAVVLGKMAVGRMEAAKKAFELDPSVTTRADWTVLCRTIEADAAVMASFNLHDLELGRPMQTFALIGGLLLSSRDIVQPLVGPHPAVVRASMTSTAKDSIFQLHQTAASLLALLEQQLLNDHAH